MTIPDPTSPRERLKRMERQLDVLAAEAYALRHDTRVDPRLDSMVRMWSMDIGEITAQVRNLLAAKSPPFREPR